EHHDEAPHHDDGRSQEHEPGERAHQDEDHSHLEASETPPLTIAAEAPAVATEAFQSAEAHDDHAREETGKSEVSGFEAARDDQAAPVEGGGEHFEPGSEERAASPSEVHSEVVEADNSHDDDEEGEETEEEVVESVGGDDVLEEVPERPYRPRRQ